MRSIRRSAYRTALIGAAALVVSAGLAAPAHAAPFGSGNLVVYRVGTGTSTLTSAATEVFLDEFSSTVPGGPTQTIPLPTAPSGANKRLTASGSATSEGLISRSVDGCSVVLTGYDAAAGTASVVSTPSSTTNRIVGKVDGAGVVDTTSALTTQYTGNNIRSAASTDGTNLWTSGTATSTGGIHSTTLGAPSVTQLVNANLRQVHIFGGQLYTSSGAAAPLLGVSTVGVGLPTTSGQTVTNLPGVTGPTSPYGFVLLDRDGSAGLDTLYIADDGLDVVHKFELSAGAWAARGTFPLTNPRGLTGKIGSSGVELYVTEDAVRLIKLDDSSAFGANLSGVASTLATAAANTAFRGVAFTPDACGPGPVIPEASMVVLLPLGALAVMGAAYVVLRPRKVLA